MNYKFMKKQISHFVASVSVPIDLGEEVNTPLAAAQYLTEFLNECTPTVVVDTVYTDASIDTEEFDLMNTHYWDDNGELLERNQEEIVVAQYSPEEIKEMVQPLLAQPGVPQQFDKKANVEMWDDIEGEISDLIVGITELVGFNVLEEETDSPNMDLVKTLTNKVIEEIEKHYGIHFGYVEEDC
jgi:hypothetical protein